MSPGKLASQAGHAFLDTFAVCQKENPELAAEYHSGRHGTKVVAGATNEGQLMKAYELAKAAGLPCALIIDSGHVMPPFFDGNPIVTALGIGPARRDEIHAITKRFQLVK